MNTIQNIDDGHHDAGDMDGDRGIPQVGRKKPPSRIWFLMVVGVVAVFIAAAAAVAAMNKVKNRNKGSGDDVTAVVSDQPKLDEAAFTGAPPLPEDPMAVADLQGTPPVPCAPGQMPTTEAPCVVNYAGPAPTPGPAVRPAGLSAAQQAALDLAERRKRAPVTLGSAGSGRSAGDGAEDAMGNDHGSLGGALKATRTGAVSATLLRDPNLMITQGRLLPCTLETAISSEVAGMTSCVLTRDIYSTNGRVLLLERGTRIVGQYQAGQLRRGLKRIFVLWTRAETPNGVLVHLDSPAADSLGRSGVTGRVNRHFWERFGAALLVSLVDDLGNYHVARQQARDEDGTSVTFNTGTQSTEQAANIIIGNSINIPPTLEREHGSSLAVFVARDLYFGDVYALRSAGMN